MGLVNGTNIIVYDEDIALGHTVNCTLSFKMDVPETTSKSSGGWFECIAGKRGATMKIDGLVDYSDQMNYNQFVDRLITRKYTKWVFQGASMFYFGGGYITAVEEIVERENSVKYSLDIMIDGRVYFEPRLPWNLVFTNWENINIEWQNV